MEQNTQPVGFTLRKIVTEQFAIVGELFKEGKTVDLSTNIRFGSDKTNRMVGVFCLFKFGIEEQPFLLIETSCHFQIEDKNWQSFSNEENDAFLIPKGFATHLAMLTVGTTRGVLHAKTEDTDFNRFILPTINVAELIEEDIKL